MLHFAPESLPESRPEPYAEAIARLASIRHALRLVEPFGGGPGGDVGNEDERIASAWDDAGSARQHCFGKRSERVIAATGAGLDALLAEHEASREPHASASRRLAEEIRAGLEDLAHLMLGGGGPAARLSGPDSYPFAL